MSGSKKGCTPKLWESMIVARASELGLNAGLVLAGDKRRKYLRVRWEVIKTLMAANYSAYSIAKASGFDHTTILHANCRDLPRIPKPRRRPYLYAKKAQMVPDVAHLVAAE